MSEIVPHKSGNRKQRREKDKKSKAVAGVDNTHRRTWDIDEYTEKAVEREAKV
jgi:hypothetical protein